MDGLLRLPLEELQRRWLIAVAGSPLRRRLKPPPQRRMLARDLAWLLQAPAARTPDAVFDAITRRLLDAAVREAIAPRSRRSASSKDADPAPSDHPASPSRPRSGVRRRSAQVSEMGLPEGARLVRRWGGRIHEVEIVDGGRGFLYEGRRYASLSEAARAITGARWSGPGFFGLTATRQRTARPEGA